MTTSFPGSRCTRALLLLAVLVAMSGLAAPWVAHAQQPREMRFGVRINSNTLAWFNQVARPIDVAAVHSRDVGMLDQITAGRKQVLFASVAEAERMVPALASKINVIAYDLEHWPATPADEQADPVGAVERLRTLADKYGLAVALGPDRRFTAEYGAQMAPYVDEYTLQVQRLQADPQTLLSFATPLIQELRRANPQVKIVIQLRTEGTVDDLLAVVATLRQDIDGVSILTNPATLPVAQEFVRRLQATGNSTPALSPEASPTAMPPEGTPTAVEPPVTAQPRTGARATSGEPVRLATPDASATHPVQVTPTLPASPPATTAVPSVTGPASLLGPFLIGVLAIALIAGGAALFLHRRRKLGGQ
jgi:hypothetical protein